VSTMTIPATLDPLIIGTDGGAALDSMWYRTASQYSPCSQRSLIEAVSVSGGPQLVVPVSAHVFVRPEKNLARAREEVGPWQIRSASAVVDSGNGTDDRATSGR